MPLFKNSSIEIILLEFVPDLVIVAVLVIY
jgi:hypothetical protein